MPASIAIPQIVKAVMHGIKTAQEEYERWTGGALMQMEAPEYLLTVYVARELWRIKRKKYLLLECSPKYVLEKARAMAPGPVPKGIREKGRFDIVLYWGNGYPRAAIELKGWVRGYESIAADMKRLEGVVHRAKDKSTLQFALMAYYTCAENSERSTAEAQLDKWILKVEAKAQNAIGARTTTETRRLPVFYTRDGKFAQTAVSILLKPKNS